jgi:hypothetical protein
MFPLRSGIGNVNTPSPIEIHNKSLMAAAMHEIGQQAILDTSILMFHQQAADVYYRESENTPITTDADGNYDLYTPDEHDEIKSCLIDVVMKFHIFDENGLANKLTPLIEHMKTNEPLPQEAIDDPFIQDIIATQNQYSGSVFGNNTKEILSKICDFNLVENLTPEQNEMIIKASYADDADNMVNVAVFEDGVVQCACSYCEKYFTALGNDIDRDTLNSVQTVMAENYNF